MIGSGGKEQSMETTREPFDIADATAVLSRTPGVLRTFLVGLTESWLGANEAADAPFASTRCGGCP